MSLWQHKVTDEVDVSAYYDALIRVGVINVVFCDL